MRHGTKNSVFLRRRAVCVLFSGIAGILHLSPILFFDTVTENASFRSDSAFPYLFCFRGTEIPVRLFHEPAPIAVRIFRFAE